MPRRSKGPRLWLQPQRKREDGTIERAVWLIRDGTVKRSTGAGPRESTKAEKALAAYIISKSQTSRISNRDATQVRVADVISIYSTDVAHKHARPGETAARLGRVLDFFGEMTLADINRRACADYVTARGHAAASRRELEDFRAAIRHHWENGLCSSLTPIVLPDRGVSRERWLTRSEAAQLLLAAWRSPLHRHIARFILVALYTGSRAGAVCGAALRPTEGRGWIDLEHGVFYRRAIGRRETKKRQPSVRLSARLLVHMRRWQRLRLSNGSVVEYHGRPVRKINKGFRAVRRMAGLGAEVVPHVFRHTAITWQAQRGTPVYEICGYFGVTRETFEQVYAHHHPDHQESVVRGFSRPDRIGVNETRQTATNVVKINRIS
jgi:integrase